MKNADLKTLLEQSVARLEPNTAENRLKVYRAAQKAFAEILKDKPAQEVSQRNREMFEAIKSIEARFAPRQADVSAEPDPDNVSEMARMQQGAGEPAHAVSLDSAPTPDFAADDPSISDVPGIETADADARVAPQKNRRGWLTGLLILLFLLILIAIGWYVVTLVLSTRTNTYTVGEPSASPASDTTSQQTDSDRKIRIIDTEGTGQ